MKKRYTRDLGLIVKATRDGYTYRRNRLAFGCRGANRFLEHDSIFDVEFGADQASFLLPLRSNPLPKVLEQGSFQRMQQSGGLSAKQRQTEARPLGVRFYLSCRGFLFHGKYPGHLRVRRSPIYGPPWPDSSPSFLFLSTVERP